MQKLSCMYVYTSLVLFENKTEFTEFADFGKEVVLCSKPGWCLSFRRRSVIVGAGYIAVEMAGILSSLGSKTSLIIRQGGVRGPFPYTKD